MTTWPALDELEAALAGATSGEWVVAHPFLTVIDAGRDMAIVETEASADAAAIVAAVNLAPKLIAAVRAVEDMADELARRAAKWAERDESRSRAVAGAYAAAAHDLRAALAAALGDPQPDTRQCPATRDDGYRCQAFTAHDKHVDSIGRMW